MVRPEHRLDERAESPIGRLCLRGLITHDQYDAATRYVAIVAAYQASIGAPFRGNGTGRGYACSGELCTFYPDLCACTRRRDAYDRAFESLSKVGQRAAKMVSRIVIWQEEPSGGWHAQSDALFMLRVGLNALVAHFGLTRADRIVYSGNTSCITAS